MVKKKFTSTRIVKGKAYNYFRRGGVFTRLPDDVNSQEYDREYWRLMSGRSGNEKKFTFDKLITSYKQSPRWSKLTVATKQDYHSKLDYIGEKLGKKSPALMRRAHVIEAQTANKHRARFANYLVQILSILFEHAIDLDKMQHNPAKGVEKIKTGDGHQTWPEPLIESFAAACDPQTRIMFELAISTGQRISDILRMKWADIEDCGINVTQSKTGTVLWIPFTPRLEIFLATVTKNGFYLLTNNKGQQMSYNTIQKKFTKVRTEVNGNGFVIHGLRYYAAHQLAEAGCTDSQIAAITGHKSLEMVAKYSRKSNQKKLAKAAQRLRT